MELKQISTLLNNVVIPNSMGETTTVAENLSNIVDIGTALADATADQVKNFAESLIVGVAKNYFDTRRYEASSLGLMTDSQTYGGIIQSVKAKLLDTMDAPLWTLTSGQNYFDGTYYGVDLDAKIYTEDSIWMVPYSIPVEEFKQYFTGAEGVLSLIGIIESTHNNTIDRDLHALAKRTLCKLATSCNASRKINMVTVYNTNMGLTGADALTASTCLYDAGFLRFFAQTIKRLREYVQEYNTKYNDGSIECFTPANDTRCTILSEVDTAIKYNMMADTFNEDMVRFGSYNTITSWQNPSDDLLPSLGVTAEIKETDGATSPTVTDMTNVAAIIYDKYSAGITARLDKITTQYIAKGDYNTHFHNIANKRFIDTRNAAIVLTLN